MYNIKIIIVALGYKEGNNLLSKLFNEGIYNFVLLLFIKKSRKLLRKKEFYDIRYNRYSVSERMENEYE